MANESPVTLFLAGSTVELISALACITSLKVANAIVFVERNISFSASTMTPLLNAARLRFPEVKFVELAIQRLSPGAPIRNMLPFVRRWRAIQSIQKQLDIACKVNFGIDLNTFGASIQNVYFTGLHDYVLVFLAACHERMRVFYPHGFDHPRRQQVKDYSYLLRRRSIKTIVQTLAEQKKHFGLGGLFLGIIGLVSGKNTVNLPFAGVDQVLTFRTGINYVPNEVLKIEGLAEIFRWLMGVQPWDGLLESRRTNVMNASLLLLLPECNCHPIWDRNRNYGIAHLRMLQTISKSTNVKRIVIKAHVRSDGTAAAWLANFLKQEAPDWDIEVLPVALSGLPVEAIAMTGEFVAAASLGSCSLPPGLGFGIPHYVSLKASTLFDEGWDHPSSLNYANGAQMLIQEGICFDIESKNKL